MSRFKTKQLTAGCRYLDDVARSARGGLWQHAIARRKQTRYLITKNCCVFETVCSLGLVCIVRLKSTGTPKRFIVDPLSDLGTQKVEPSPVI